jgi:hypothetical protein
MAALYLDEDVRYDAKNALAALGHSVMHANDHRKGAKDDIQLLVAADAGCVFVTCNQKDYLLLHDAWQHRSQRWGVHPEHAGILLVANSWPAQLVAERVHAFFATHPTIRNRLYRWNGDRGWIEHVPSPL